MRKSYVGKIWLEIFIVPGLNDSNNEIRLFRETIHLIQPDLVQLNTLDRPGTDRNILPATKKKLEEIANLLDWETEIIAKFTGREEIASYNTDIENSILQTLKRRPCTFDDLSATLGIHPRELNKYLKTLISKKIISEESMDRGVFFKVMK